MHGCIFHAISWICQTICFLVPDVEVNLHGSRIRERGTPDGRNDNEASCKRMRTLNARHNAFTTAPVLPFAICKPFASPPPPNTFQRSACRFQTPVFWNQRIDFPIIVYRMPGRYAGVSCGRFIRAPSKISGSLFPSYPVRNQSFNPAEITRRAQVGSNRLVCGSQTTVLPTVPPCESVNPSVLLNHRVTAVWASGTTWPLR